MIPVGKQYFTLRPRKQHICRFQGLRPLHTQEILLRIKYRPQENPSGLYLCVD
jgi:hypothetical protein